MSDYRDQRAGLRDKIEQLEQRLRELVEEQERISVYLDSGRRMASRFNRAMLRLGRAVGRLIRGRRARASKESSSLRAKVAALEERIERVDATVDTYRWPRKTSPFYDDPGSYGHSENTEMDTAASESANDAPAQGGREKS